MEASDRTLDGNALAGLLGELAGMEPTTARCVCGGCGRSAMVAEARLYADAPGAVLRCPGCEEVLLVVVEADGRYVVGLERLRALELRR